MIGQPLGHRLLPAPVPPLQAFGHAVMQQLTPQLAQTSVGYLLDFVVTEGVAVYSLLDHQPGCQDALQPFQRLQLTTSTNRLHHLSFKTASHHRRCANYLAAQLIQPIEPGFDNRLHPRRDGQGLDMEIA